MKWSRLAGQGLEAVRGDLEDAYFVRKALPVPAPQPTPTVVIPSGAPSAPERQPSRAERRAAKAGK